MMRIYQTVSGSTRKDTKGFFKGMIKDEYGNIALIKDFENNHLPATIEWNGTNIEGNTVPGKYVYTLTAQDEAGNTQTVTTAPFELVTKQADIKVFISRYAFSPNKDGKADIIRFLFDSNKKEQIAEMSLMIYNNDSKNIKTITATGFRKSLTWNGVDQSQKIAPEGNYNFVAKCKLNNGETPQTSKRNFYIDITPIVINLSVEKTIFSPNADGVNDYMLINQVKQASKWGNQKDTIELQIVGDNNTVYKTGKWTGTLPPKVRWNGLDDAGNPVPEGNDYRYILKTTDGANNQKQYTSPAIRLIRRVGRLDLKLSANRLTYNKTPYSTNHIDFVPNISLTRKSKVTDPLSRLTYLFKTTNAQGLREQFNVYTGPMKQPWQWNGRTIKRERIPDGTYHVWAKVAYESGNVADNRDLIIVMDSTPPDIIIRSQPDYFSPDGDGLSEELQIRITQKDNDQIQKSRAFIYRKIFMRDKILFKQTLHSYRSYVPSPFMEWDLGSKTNVLLKWNGMSTAQQLVESANDYMLYVESVDKAGNVQVVGSMIQIDVLVEKLPDGRLRIILNSLNFVFDSTKLIGDYQKTLDRLVYILYKFPQYKIHIIGHTDSQGEVNYNQVLSEKRAKVVVRYLVREGIDKERISDEGKGESENLKLKEITNIEEKHRRNRRVEIYLDKLSRAR